MLELCSSLVRLPKVLVTLGDNVEDSYETERPQTTSFLSICPKKNLSTQPSQDTHNNFTHNDQLDIFRGWMAM